MLEALACERPTCTIGPSCFLVKNLLNSDPDTCDELII